MARLLVIKGADEGKQFELAQPTVVIGRDTTSAIRLHDTEVSRRHAELRKSNDGYTLADVGSANGTFVNNERITEAVLQPGDHIAVGQSILVYSTGRPTAGAATGDLAEQINLITRGDIEMSSAIIRTIGAGEGSRILTQPDKHSLWLKTALANLAIMYEASQAVSLILDIDQLMGRILELVFRSVVADRGCFLVQKSEGGELEPRALRWRNETQPHGAFPVSRTIVEHVQKHNVGVLCSDAARDDRFSTGQSIIRYGIREVICVPMQGRHETLGVLYLDTQVVHPGTAPRDTSMGKFTDDHLSLAIAVAHQAALAIEETRYHQAMVQAERLAAIGQTIAALSHHIKNILQGLRTGGDLLRMGLSGKDDELLRKGWNIIEKNQGKVNDLVLDMLSYSKEREPSVEPTDLNALASDVVELMEARARERGVTLELAERAALPHWPADPEGLHRALLNIVGNALDAVEEAETPTVRVRTVREADEGWVRLEVEDNGSGIAPEKMAEIFRPFVSTKGARGTGLGLAVSRKILREHGGDIVVSSEVGKGSVFALRLPWRSTGMTQEHNTLVPGRPPEPD
jgi:signal transduction histidine kinase